MIGMIFNGIRVSVYRNLNNGCWSVVSLDASQHKGKVILHCQDVILESGKFIVSEAGRQRVIAEQRKNVHAYAEGFLRAATVITERYNVAPTTVIHNPNGAFAESVEPGEVEVSYNPYKAAQFFEKDSGEFVEGPVAEIHLNADKTVSILREQLQLAA